MSERARENVLESDRIKSELKFVTSDEEEAERILELWPSEWPLAVEKSKTLITMISTGSLSEIQERIISFLDKLKEAGLPRSQNVSIDRTKKNAGDDTSDQDEVNDDSR